MSITDLYQFRAADHSCIFYRNDLELLDSVAPFLLQGIRLGERCFAAQQANFLPILRARLDENLDTKAAEETGSLTLLTVEETYFSGGFFSPDVMIAKLQEESRKAVSNGYSGFRTAGDLSWVKDKATFEQLLKYESMVDQAMRGIAFRGLCQYPFATYSSAVVDRIFLQHRLMLQELPEDGKKYGFSIRNDKVFAELVADRHDPNTRVYYTIQRIGSPDIVSMGSGDSFDCALREAESEIDFFSVQGLKAEQMDC